MSHALSRTRESSPGAPIRGPRSGAGLTPVLERNIEALQRRREKEARAASIQERIADAITRFTGSMLFVYIHLLVVGFWIAAILSGCPGCRPGIDLVEAIFLSTFVLITQNRMATAAAKRADLGA